MLAIPRCRRLLVVVAALALLGTASVGQAAIYGFVGMGPGDSTTNIDIGEAQFTVEVTSVEGNPNQAKFIFRNLGPDASSITDVYFDDGTLLGMVTPIESSSGVAFSPLAAPSDVPNGNIYNFQTSAGFSADSDPPASLNGVNPDEWMAITFNLQGGLTYLDVINAMDTSLLTPKVDVFGGLRIALHAQAFPDGSSEWFVNGGKLPEIINPPVPEPGTMTMWGLGLAMCSGLGYWRNRRQKAAA